MASNGRVVGQGCEKSSKAKKQARNRANRAKAKAGAKAKAEANTPSAVCFSLSCLCVKFHAEGLTIEARKTEYPDDEELDSHFVSESGRHCHCVSKGGWPCHEEFRIWVTKQAVLQGRVYDQMITVGGRRIDYRVAYINGRGDVVSF